MGCVIGLILLAESQDSFRFIVMVACIKSSLKYIRILRLGMAMVWKEKGYHLLAAHRIVLSYLHLCFSEF